MFYFHVIDDLDATDEEGKELSDADAARQWAIQGARGLMCETLTQEGRITLRHRIDIEDENHEVIESVTFAEAIEIRD